MHRRSLDAQDTSPHPHPRVLCNEQAWRRGRQRAGLKATQGQAQAPPHRMERPLLAFKTGAPRPVQRHSLDQALLRDGRISGREQNKCPVHPKSCVEDSFMGLPSITLRAQTA